MHTIVQGDVEQAEELGLKFFCRVVCEVGFPIQDLCNDGSNV